MQYVFFTIDQKKYAVNIKDVKEIRSFADVIFTQPPMLSDYVSGIMNLRNKVHAVLDMAKILDNNIGKKTRNMIIVMSRVPEKWHTNQNPPAFFVDKVVSVKTVDSLEGIPDGILANNTIMGLLKDHENELISVLNLDGCFEKENIGEDIK